LFNLSYNDYVLLQQLQAWYHEDFINYHNYLLRLYVVFINWTWLCSLSFLKLTLPFTHLDASLGHSHQVLQHSILLRTSRLLFRNISHTCQISRMRIYINFWPFRYNLSPILYQLHENEILWKELTLLHGSFRITCHSPMLHNALHIKRRNEGKDQGRRKLKRIRTQYTLIYIFFIFYSQFTSPKHICSLIKKNIINYAI
jgi:hypothetical protein